MVSGWNGPDHFKKINPFSNNIWELSSNLLKSISYLSTAIQNTEAEYKVKWLILWHPLTDVHKSNSSHVSLTKWFILAQLLLTQAFLNTKKSHNLSQSGCLASIATFFIILSDSHLAFPFICSSALYLNCPVSWKELSLSTKILSSFWFPEWQHCLVLDPQFLKSSLLRAGFVVLYRSLVYLGLTVSALRENGELYINEMTGKKEEENKELFFWSNYDTNSD